MSKARSPSYPAIGLKEAIDKAELVYAKDYLNAVPKAVIANHMGYKGLSGASLPIIAALSQYGLLDGRGDDTRVSELALAIIAHEPGSEERFHAIHSAATRPELFSELFKKFPGGKASDAAIRAHLLTTKFIPAAADTAIRSYRETIELLNSEKEWYSHANPETEFRDETDTRMNEANENGASLQGAPRTPFPRGETKQTPYSLADQYLLGVKREETILDEGEAVLLLPENLSLESVRDLQYWLEGILKKAKRRAGLKSPSMQEKMAAAIKANMVSCGVDSKHITDEMIASIVDGIE